MKTYNLENIEDIGVRENFQRLIEDFKAQSLLKGNFKFITLTFLGAVTNFKFQHHLGFLPKDVLQTSLTGAGSLTWNYAKFDKTNIDITTTGACVVRAFVGTYVEAT